MNSMQVNLILAEMSMFQPMSTKMATGILPNNALRTEALEGHE